MYESEIRPYWLMVTKGYGLTIDDIDWSCPAELEPYNKAHAMEKKEQDEQLWSMGIYVESAVRTAIDRSFNVKKATSKYIEKPILQTLCADDGLTQEERDEKELKKMLLYEEQWAINDRMRGLPETKIL